MKHAITILFATALILSGCGIKRDNPLDPIGNPDIMVPATVANVTCTPSPAGAANKFVEVRWTANSPLNTDGYFVYRGLSFFSEFTVVDTVFTNICNHGSEPWQTVFPGTYWYKVSAFKDIKDSQQNILGRLEGRLSEARAVIVPA